LYAAYVGILTEKRRISVVVGKQNAKKRNAIKQAVVRKSRKQALAPSVVAVLTEEVYQD
jgi:hypothetical protein